MCRNYQHALLEFGADNKERDLMGIDISRMNARVLQQENVRADGGISRLRVAPSVLRSTPSRKRSRRVAATALNSTGTPSARLISARNRTAIVTFPSTFVTVC